MGSPPREWDSSQYHQLSDPQFNWGLKVLGRLELRGDETVLDGGCGTGRVTAELLRRLPKGRVIASNISENMLRSAREYLEPMFGDRVSFLQADMLDLPLEGEVDCVFSTAAFHWVKDHERLFRSLYRTLHDRGKIVAQCGGGANLEIIYGRARHIIEDDPDLAPLFDTFRPPVLFASPEQTTGRLRAAGFVDAEAWLEPTPTTLPDAQTFREFLKTVVLRAHVARLPQGGADYLLDRMTELAAEDFPPFTLDYWRLNITAKKAWVTSPRFP